MALQLQVMITTKYRATSDDKVDIMTNLRFQCLFDANFVVPGGTGFLRGLWTENREWYHDHCRFSIFVCSMAEMHLAYKGVERSNCAQSFEKVGTFTVENPYLKPSMLQMTLVSLSPNWVSHTVPHMPSWRTSRRPSRGCEPFTRRTFRRTK